MLLDSIESNAVYFFLSCHKKHYIDQQERTINNCDKLLLVTAVESNIYQYIHVKKIKSTATLSSAARITLTKTSFSKELQVLAKRIKRNNYTARQSSEFLSFSQSFSNTAKGIDSRVAEACKMSYLCAIDASSWVT
ncbi:unnamed protein product [Albugo candida]|uniref:Uncharacterized protein n=1 Tax=Albugo candida TaxID=65357 RepID=A0A024GDX0_9STRA|nr:unnamed protein product [Albugo candida]|eukprot:CCI44530.1 unnamed protein product [Albugo candida]